MTDRDRLSLLESLFGQDAAFVARYGNEAVLREGRPLFWQDDPVDRAALILDGRILPVKHRLGGQDIVLPPLISGDWAALPEMTAHAASQADYVADTETVYLSFSGHNFAAIRERVSIERHLALALARSTLSLHSWLQEGGSLERIVAWILSKRKSTAGIEKASVTVTQAELARYLGLTRETVNKRLCELERNGLIETHRGGISVADWDSLSSFLASCAD